MSSNRITLWPIAESQSRGRYPIKVRDSIPITAGPPWTDYEGVVVLELAGIVVVAHRSDNTLVSISALKGKGRAADIPFQVHPNIVHIYEAYILHDMTYVVSEYMAFSISLSEISACSRGLNEPQIAMVVGEVLKGIRFLHDRQLLHGSIRTSNILACSNGVDVAIKIANLASCTKLPQGPSESLEDIRCLGITMRHLMEKGLVLCQDTMPIQNPGLWSAEAMNFNTTTAFATPGILAGHTFLKKAAPTSSILSLMLLSTLAARRYWKPYTKGTGPWDEVVPNGNPSKE